MSKKLSVGCFGLGLLLLVSWDSMAGPGLAGHVGHGVDAAGMVRRAPVPGYVRIQFGHVRAAGASKIRKHNGVCAGMCGRTPKVCAPHLLSFLP